MTTNSVIASLAQLALDLGRVGAKWAVIGGFAVSARAEPRFTRDVDACVLVDGDLEAELIVRALTRRAYVVEAIVEHEYQDRLATIRLISPVAGGVLVDLLFGSSGIEAEIVEAAESLEVLAGLTVPVAQSAALVVLKLLANDESRPQDAIDLRALRPTLTPVDEAEVRRLAGIVTARGFNRERDLLGLADDYLAGG